MAKRKADSNIETDLLNAFKKLGIEVEFQYEVKLTPPTVYKNKKVELLKDGGVQEIKMHVDFVWKHKGITYFLDTKGVKESTRDVSILKYKFLKFKLISEGLQEVSAIKFIYYAEAKQLVRLAGFQMKTEFINYLLKLQNL
jgi:hypothetical protein